jgi:2,4-dienoyl-CoA reductase-like NADH-dependent reductase (Old Yellow Enzyme family)
MTEGQIDSLDMSLWDVFKEPGSPAHKGRSLMSYFTELDRGKVRLGVAGKIARPDQARACLDAGVDFVLLGRAAIVQHDFPQQVARDPGFQPVQLPVTRAYLKAQGLGDTFVEYMRGWKGFVQD